MANSNWEPVISRTLENWLVREMDLRHLKLTMSHIPWKKLFVLCNCWMVVSLSLQLQTCLIYTEWYIQSPEICQVMLQVYEQFSSFLANFAVNILYLHWTLRTKIFVYYCKNCCKLMEVFHNILPHWRHSLCVGARPYTGCFTTLGHNCRRWFPRSLWSKKFI